MKTTAPVRLKSCSETRVAPVTRSVFSDRTWAGETSHAPHDGGTIGNHEFNYGLPYLSQVTNTPMNVDGGSQQTYTGGAQLGQAVAGAAAAVQQAVQGNG